MKIRRRAEGKTDYKARTAMLRSEKARIVFRKTNKYIIGQCIRSKEAKDSVILGLTSKELLKYGWPKTAEGSLKSLPASYLTGFVLGEKMLDKDIEEGIFDLGLSRNVKKSRAYAFLNGVIDSGVKIKAKEDVFPDEARLIGRHLKINLELNKIKENIAKRFA